MADFAKIFMVGDRQYLAFVEPDTESDEDDAYVMHQITDCGSAVIDLALRAAEPAIRKCFDAVDQKVAENFFGLGIVQKATEQFA